MSLVAIIRTTRCHSLSLDVSLVCPVINDSRKTSNDQKKTFVCALKVMLWRNWKYSRKMWTPASVNLICGFIKTGLHHGHIVAECSDYFWWGKLFHKIALISCKGVYLFSEPNQILIALIGQRRANPRNFDEVLSWILAASAFLRRTPIQAFSYDTR